MIETVIPTGETALAGYLLAFGGAGIACLLSAVRARRIEDADVRRGLLGLLLTSGVWALLQSAFLVVPTRQLQLVTYVAGLVVGFSTIGAWLYFCSAYTGRSLHQDRTIQAAAGAVFLVVVLLKVTNPLHQSYFTATATTMPFPHLAIEHGPVHWVLVGVAYSVASMGYFMLLELFWQVDHDAGRLGALVSLTALPIGPDILGVVSPLVPEIAFEPLGVALFSLGVLFVYLEEFQTLQLTARSDDPVILLDDADRIREYNAAAADLFPDLETGQRVAAVAPEIAEEGSTDGGVVEVARVGGLRYYQLSANPFSTDLSRRGQVITLSDVTDREQYRQRLERQNERLDRFASTVSHDLRNPLNIASATVEMVQEDHDIEELAEVEAAHIRMERLVEDVLALAREGKPIDDPRPVDVGAVAERCWPLVETKAATLVVDTEATVQADPDRLRQLLENLFRNAVEHGGPDVTVRVGAVGETGFYVADDGAGIPASDRSEVFASGYSTADDGTGFGLAIVAEIADAHGWDIDVQAGPDGGARFEFQTDEDQPSH